MTEAGLPLEGVRVIEMTHMVMGPTCGMILAQLGAEVIKVEPPAGDRSRGWRDDGLIYRILNRGKRGATLDLAATDAGEAVAQLAAGSDVVILDTDALAAWPHLQGLVDRPSGVVCRISLFGADGPMAGMPISELAAQLLSEATSSVGNVDTGPQRAGMDIGSTYAGIFAAQAVCAALLVHEPGDGGEVVDVSLVGALLTMRSTLWVALSNPDEWWGFHLESYLRPPFRGYQCADGRIYFDLRHAASVDWDALLADLGLADVKDDPRYPDLVVQGAGPGSRYADAAQPVWERAFRHRTVEQVDAILSKHGADVFPVNDYPELLATPQVAAVGNVVPATGDIPAHIAAPWEFSATPVGGTSPAPTLGTSARDALTDRGASREQLDRWAASGLVR
jgi:crotonobetainyl-CoA:carnitine CoA-transferase CaiB-like acyl-CoA transferase